MSPETRSRGFATSQTLVAIGLVVGAIVYGGNYLLARDQVAIDQMLLTRSDAVKRDLPTYDPNAQWGETTKAFTAFTEPGGAEEANVANSANNRKLTVAYPTTLDATGHFSGTHGAQAAERANLALAAEQTSRQPAPNTGSLDPAAQDEQADDLNDDPLDEQPNTALSISGQVLNEAGQPLPGIEVISEWTQLFNVGEYEIVSDSEREQRTRTGADGSYRFVQLAAGAYRIRTTPTPQYSSARMSVRTGIDSANLVLRARRELRVSGFVHSSTGEALEGVEVMSRSGLAEPTYSDAQGNYSAVLTLQGNSRKYYSLAFRRDDHKHEILGIRGLDYEGVDEPRLDAVLDPLAGFAAVSGKVQGSDGRPLSGQIVKLSSQQVKRSYIAVTDRAGRFTIAEVATASDYRLQVRPEAFYQDYVEQDLVVKTQGLRLPIELEPLEVGNLAGQMLDPDGNPIPNFSLWLRSQSAIRGTVQVTGDDEGYFSIEAVPQGALSLKTRAAPHFTFKDIYLPAGGEEFVDLVLDMGSHQLHGRVVDGEGEPVAVPDILLIGNSLENGVRSSSLRKTAADAQGYFRFTQLGRGRHKMMIKNLPGFRMRELAYEVGADTEDEVVVKLQALFL